MSKRVNFHTLGCKLNFSESSTIARQFENGGFERVSPTESADICIINSCSVTEHADKKCRNLIRKLHRRNPNAIIAVTGCYAQLKPYEIAAIEGVDIVLSNNNKGETYKRVLELTAKGKTEVYSCETDQITNFFAAFSSGDRTRAFLKVQDGCDYCCSYCTIHNARGSSRNIPIADVVAQAEEIVAGGQKEIVITGVNTGDFGRTTGESFADLLRALDKVEGVERYRISSIEPNLLTDEIIEICARSSKFQHHFHIPIQCGSNKVLALMRRRYTVEKFADRIAAVKRAMPDAFIGIDVITGFPGETDEDFATTLEFIRKARFLQIHAFPYSGRKNTPAIRMPGQVPMQIRRQRLHALQEEQAQIRAQLLEQIIASNPYKQVLFETDSPAGCTGHTPEFIEVTVDFAQPLCGQLHTVRLIGQSKDGCTAVLTDTSSQ